MSQCGNLGCYIDYASVALNQGQTLAFALYPFKNNDNFLIFAAFDWQTGELKGSRFKSMNNLIVTREIIVTLNYVYLLVVSNSDQCVTRYNLNTEIMDTNIYCSVTNSFESLAVINSDLGQIYIGGLYNGKPSIIQTIYSKSL